MLFRSVSQSRYPRYPNSIFSDSTYLYVGGWTTAGPRSGWNGAVIRIDKALESGSPVVYNKTLYDSTTMVREYDFRSYLSTTVIDVSAVNAGTHSDWSTALETNVSWGSTANVTTSSLASYWSTQTITSSVVNIDSETLIATIRPESDYSVGIPQPNNTHYDDVSDSSTST